MNPEEFVSELMAYFGKDLDADEIRILVAHLGRWDIYQLEAIFKKLLTKAKKWPLLAHIHEAAEDLGFETAEKKGKAPPMDQWQPTHCKLCKGEGLLIVTTRMWGTEDPDTGRVKWKQQLLAINPAHDCGDRPTEKDTYDSLFKCSCPAGTRPALVRKKFPRWKDSSSDQPREVSALDQRPKKAWQPLLGDKERPWKAVGSVGKEVMDDDEIPF